jgi:hypothetical protein
MQLINKEAICHTYKMSPNEYDRTDPQTLDAFSAIIQGRQKAQDEKIKAKK